MALTPSEAAAEPAVLYVPDTDVAVLPLGSPECAGLGVHSAAGCFDTDMEELVQPYAGDLPALEMGLQLALDPYDVHVTTTRPPDYLHYTMLLVSDVDALDDTSYTCTNGPISCAAGNRSRIATTSGSTVNCSSPDVLHAALYAFGRASGLEGVSNPDDAMGYVPDYMVPATGYVDVCSARVPQLVDEMGEPVAQLLECPSIDHFGGCGDDPVTAEQQQNSHADLLEFYGPRVVDVDPPVLSNVSPFDGQVFMAGEEVIIDMDVDEADPVLGARWTLTSPALVAEGFPDGISFCTNDVCLFSWPDANPLKPTVSDWMTELASLPEGDYELIWEAADYHGNVATPVVVHFNVGGMPGGESGGSTDEGGESSGGGSEGSGSGSGSGSGGGSSEGSGTGDGSTGDPGMSTGATTDGPTASSSGGDTGLTTGDPPNPPAEDSTAGSESVGSGSEGSAGGDVDGGGCSCTSDGSGGPGWAAMPLLLGIAGWRRRSRQVTLAARGC